MDRMFRWVAVLAFASFVSIGTLIAGSTVEFEWGDIPSMPAESGEAEALGLAGAFVGTHNGALIVAGGANFPEGLPWVPKADGRSPRKIYHDAIYVLTKSDDGVATWRISDVRLSGPAAYGVAVSTANGVVCVGGHWKEDGADGGQLVKRSDRTFAIQWVDGVVKLDESYPALPAARTDMGGSVVNGKLMLVGGDVGEGATADLLSLDLSEKTAWEALLALPGDPRVLPVVGTQRTAQGEQLFVFSGRNPHKHGAAVLLSDGWRFDSKSGAWYALSGVLVDGDARCIMGAVALPSGNAHLVVVGGASGDGFVKLAYEYPEGIAAAKAAGDDATAAALETTKLALLNNHPGFSPDVLLYHAITDTWIKTTEIPGVPAVTTGAAGWDGMVVIPTGERSPGIRTPSVTAFKISVPRSFGALNYLILGLYLCGILINGAIFSRKMKSTDDYFKAGGRIPWWAAGLSIFGTQLSAITFIAIPAKVYTGDWRLFIGQLGIIMVAPLIVMWFLPFFRRLNVTTAYEYLEMRFNVFVRCFGSTMFILLQFSRIGIVLYLPSVALSIVTGMSVDLCILVMGALCIVYTAMGGMEAVIWTDVTQVVILLGGALLCLFMLPSQVGGWNVMVQTGLDNGKFLLVDFRWDLAQPAFLVVLLGSLCANLISYGTDQSVIQRYLTTKTEKQAARSIWTNAILTVPASMLFFLIGTALFVFFKTRPAALDPTLVTNEALFPLYIVNNLPQGIAGLLIASVFAASMSSLDSAMNSVSAAVTTDFYRRFNQSVAEVKCLKLARITTVVVGCLGITFAIGMAHSNIQSLWDQFMFFVGLFGGGLGGIFLLAIFTRKAHGLGAASGLIGSGIIQFLLANCTDMNKWFFAFTGLGSCFIIGLIVSIVVPQPKKDDTGLTVYTLAKAGDENG